MCPIITNTSESNYKNEWLELLFENIEIIREQGIVVPFKIIDIKKSGFLIKTKGLYAYVPFALMPWIYYHTQYWEAIFLSLKEKLFFGKVIRLDRKSEDSRIARIFVDARETLLTDAPLSHNTDYAGIVVQKREYGVIVDIGYHFNWKCGSMLGLLHQSKFPGPESFSLCEPGQVMTVNYMGTTEKGLSFEKEGYVDLHAKYAGKMIRVKVCRKENGNLDFMTEDQFKAVLPVTKTIYGQHTKPVKNMMSSWVDGMIIDCEVLKVNRQTELFTVKWLPQKNDDEFNWYSDEMRKYIGKQVTVNVYKNELNESIFFVENKYPAILSGKNAGKHRLLNNLREGDIIYCKIISIEVESGRFVVKWKNPHAHRPNEYSIVDNLDETVLQQLIMKFGGLPANSDKTPEVGCEKPKVQIHRIP